MTPPGRVLPFSLVCLMTAVSLISGDIYIPPPQVTLGCIRTALSSLVLTLLVVRMCGSPQSCRVKLFCVPSLTIVLSFSVTVPDVVPPGPGLWKLNTSILEESDYVRQIENLWSSWRDQKERFPSVAKWWEAGKSRIKELSINYCCAKSSDNAVKRDLLSRLASHLK